MSNHVSENTVLWILLRVIMVILCLDSLSCSNGIEASSFDLIVCDLC